MQKKILIVEDLSVLGKTSLATAIPIITAYGHESISIPTALLSANTAYKGFTYLDLTEEMGKIFEHLNSLGYEGDAIYTGYLGSVKQIDLILNYLEKHPKLNYYLDPAMADNGKLYTGFDLAFVKEMQRLARKALVIMPNLTEAQLLLDLEPQKVYSDLEIKELLKKLANMGPKIVIITGIESKNKLINYAYDSGSEKVYSYSYPRLNSNYYGTGDIFASLITGALEKNISLDLALERAGDFLYKAIDYTNKEGNDPLAGVCFEPFLKTLGGKAYE